MDAATASADPREVSEQLERFVAEFPYERRTLLAFVRAAAASLPAGSRVLDVGAGDAPYAELFSHVEYLTSDWEHSEHPGAREADYVASADALPLPEGSVDAVLCTQVLEHVPKPASVLRELHRVLRPAGRLFVTVPLVWELHELPYDFYRYTGPGVEWLLRSAGFEAVVVEPRNDCFTTLAQLMRNVGATMGRADDGLDRRREEATELLLALADRVAALAPLDARHILPLGYQATATRAA